MAIQQTKKQAVTNRSARVKKISSIKKRVVHKAVARKVPKHTARKVHKKKIAPEKYFWINNGPVVRDLDELCNALTEIDDEQFYHHTKREKGVNDFARWVEDVFGDVTLSQKLKKTGSRVGTRRVIIAHISLS